MQTIVYLIVAKKLNMKSFYECIGVRNNNSEEIKKMSKRLNISKKILDYYNDNHILPNSDDLQKIETQLNISSIVLKIRMGIIDNEILKILSENEFFFSTYSVPKPLKNFAKFPIEFNTKLGSLYRGDCISFLQQVSDEKYDLIFADPPFNLDKFYLSEIDDSMSDASYLEWSYSWIDLCIQKLKPGGSFFIWNLPKWNTYFSKYLNDKLLFRNWIAVDMKFSLPIASKLYPSHYSLLYYSKGIPNVFAPDRLPMEVCKKCYSEIKDYGGYKSKMNPRGINLSDVWFDIPPVRHSKYKRRKEANELSLKLMDRIIELSTNPGDLVFDPFGGAGTTYIAAELKERRWEGIELGPLEDIKRRFDLLKEEKDLINKYRSNYNQLFPSRIKSQRKKLKLWTDDSFKNGSLVKP